MLCVKVCTCVCSSVGNCCDYVGCDKQCSPTVE